jgi:hypothetical protein
MQLKNGGRLKLLAAIFGDFIEIEIPLLRMNAEEAIELSQALIVHAHLLQDRELKPENRLLPLSEAFSLSLGSSCGNETPALQRAGETFSRQ